MKRRLLVACIVSALTVLSGPFMGQVRAAIRTAFPAQFVLIIGMSVAVVLALALASALMSIRDRRTARYVTLAGALVIGIGYSIAQRSGIPEVDVVERVHFIEYGIITLLFYRVWRPAVDPSIFILPSLAAVMVGTSDEWLQWFVPVRVGEARDVLLNLIAIGCGLLFAAAIDPPPAFASQLQPGSRFRIRRLATAAVLLFAAFVDAVHLGQTINVNGIDAFKSHYSADQLAALSRDRMARWRLDPPIVLKRFSREDQYMDEGLWHIRRRNESWTAGDFRTASRENLILETFFAPVLDTPSYASREPGRWSAVQEAEADTRASGDKEPFTSTAEPYPIRTWRRSWFWAATLLLCASLWIVRF